MLDAVYIDAHCHVAGLVNHAVAVADFHSQRVEEDDGVELITLAVVPYPELTVLVYAPLR